MKKRLLAVLLAVMMLLQTLPMEAMAAEANGESEETTATSDELRGVNAEEPSEEPSEEPEETVASIVENPSEPL